VCVCVCVRQTDRQMDNRLLLYHFPLDAASIITHTFQSFNFLSHTMSWSQTLLHQTIQISTYMDVWLAYGPADVTATHCLSLAPVNLDWFYLSGKGKGRVLDIALLTWVKLMTRSTLQYNLRSGVLTGNDTRWRSAIRGCPLPERTTLDRSLQLDKTHPCPASRTRPSPHNSLR